MVLFHRLTQYLSQAASGLLAQSSILLLLGLQAIRYLVELIPLATLLAIMLSLGRLYRDSEMVAIRACGLGTAAIYRPLLIFALPFALVLSILALAVVPLAMQLQYQIRSQAQQEAELSIFQAGSFREILSGKHVVYVSHMSADNQRLNNIFVFTDDAGIPTITTSEYGRQKINPETGIRTLILSNGHRYQGIANDTKEAHIIQFKQLNLRIDTTPQDRQRLRRKAQPTEQLLAIADPRAQAELQRRYSAPISLLLLTLLAPLLAHSRPREGRYGRVVAAILIYTIYVNLLNVTQAWVEKSLLPQSLGLWWVHGLFLIIIGLLWWSLYGSGFNQRLPKQSSC